MGLCFLCSQGTPTLSLVPKHAPGLCLRPAAQSTDNVRLLVFLCPPAELTQGNKDPSPPGLSSLPASTTHTAGGAPPARIPASARPSSSLLYLPTRKPLMAPPQHLQRRGLHSSAETWLPALQRLCGWTGSDREPEPSPGGSGNPFLVRH